ncbi:hypothetical protein [Streptomyces sp. NPDC059805]|uniref:hypothetical protein n=1 Tax=Streptomyces sp. NPDC059805 TaxID=3346954 RepID=UPI003647F3C2
MFVPVGQAHKVFGAAGEPVGKRTGQALGGGLLPQRLRVLAELVDAGDVRARRLAAVEPRGIGDAEAVAQSPVDATVVEALMCVESRRAVLAPLPAGSNDLLAPIRDGLITAEHVHAELGELIVGDKPGRTAPDQITLYKSVGVAVQDAAATALVVASARERSIGEEITLR